MKTLALPRVVWMMGTTRVLQVASRTGGALSYLVNQGCRRVHVWSRQRFIDYVENVSRELDVDTDITVTTKAELRARIEACLKTARARAKAREPEVAPLGFDPEDLGGLSSDQAP